MLTRSAIILLIIIQILNKNVRHDEVDADDFPKIKETLQKDGNFSWSIDQSQVYACFDSLTIMELNRECIFYEERFYLHVNRQLDRSVQQKQKQKINLQCTNFFLLFMTVGVLFMAFDLQKILSRILICQKKTLYTPYLSRKAIILIAFCLTIPTASGCFGNCINCFSNGACWQCPVGFYISGQVCNNCNLIANCTYCSGYTSQCTICLSGFLPIQTTFCTPCSSFISNCTNCYFGPPSVRCSQCATGFYLNQTRFLCESCPLRIPACVACTSNLICTLCVNSTYRINSISQCELCGVSFISCSLCNSTTCLKCFDGYYIGNNQQNCFFCNTTLNNCSLCNSSTICTRCVDNTFLIVLNRCIPCAQIFPYCVTCSQTRCFSCVRSMYLGADSTCKCVKGSLIDGLCISVPGCTAAMIYRNMAHCLSCQSTHFNYNTATVKCECKTGFLINNQCINIYGCITMRVINGTQVCLMCNASNHFLINNGKCDCEQRYYLNQTSNNCQQICGDGVIIYLQCDDGNLIDGDGCSSSCRIQNRFKCYNRSLTPQSQCLAEFEDYGLKIIEISKIPQSNTAYFEVLITNFNKFLQIIDWKRLFTLNISQNHSSISMELKKNKLKIRVDYNEDLQGRLATLSLNLSSQYFLSPSMINITFEMISSNAPLIITEYPNLNTLNILSIVILILCFLSLFLIFLAAFYHKMVAVQTISVLQVFLAAPYIISDRSVVLYIFDNLTYLNGYGKTLFYDTNNDQTFRQSFQKLSIPKTFTQSMLINQSLIIIVFILLLMGIIVKMLCLKINKNGKTANLNYFLYIIFCNLAFTLSISLFFVTFLSINANNLRVYEYKYTGERYDSTQNYNKIHSRINTLGALLVIILITITAAQNMLIPTITSNIINVSKNQLIVKLNKSFQNLHLKTRYYVNLFITYHFLLFSLITLFLFMPHRYSIFVVSFIVLSYSIYIFVHRPYKLFIDNFGICFGQITLLLFVTGLSVKQYYCIKRIGIKLNNQLIGAISITCMLSIFVFTSYIRTWMKCRCKSREIPKNKEQIIAKQENDLSYMRMMKQFKQNRIQKRIQPFKLPFQNTNFQTFSPKNRIKNTLIEKYHNQDHPE